LEPTNQTFKRIATVCLWNFSKLTESKKKQSIPFNHTSESKKVILNERRRGINNISATCFMILSIGLPLPRVPQYSLLYIGEITVRYPGRHYFCSKFIPTLLEWVANSKNSAEPRETILHYPLTPNNIAFSNSKMDNVINLDVSFPINPHPIHIFAPRFAANL